MPPGVRERQRWRLVDLCETSGIDSLWFSDRLSSPLHVLEPLTTMAAVAARTRRLKFGPSVIVAPFRSPVLLAREMAMIDYLSGGRMLPAVGIGVEQEGEFRAAGVPFKERGRRTEPDDVPGRNGGGQGPRMGQPRPSGSSGEPEREEGNQYGRNPAKQRGSR